MSQESTGRKADNSDLARTNKEQTNPHDLTWIGLQAKGSSWEWSDRSKVDYINWAPKQPDNPGKENCVEIAQDTSDHGWYENWNNENCDVVMRAFVCKKQSIV
ncbi:lectin C-type domain protein [Necator americanus]|uniref:Lectin C-type domain protein n=1 Tax=Necator americanus TaxID=51031 RepID=W2TXP2_NECAM|nr:lectin C-type domain protein [Necator americanus]ETN86449.1 lectin C-type domain protein [Necator americanus]